MHAIARTSAAHGTLAFVLAVGTVTWSISEPIYWGRLTVEGNDPFGALLTWTLYCGVTYVVLVALERLRVRGLAGIFLVGALLGWLIEGAVVPEVYTNLPFSLVWTALAWHALLTVCGGWWLLPRVLRRGGWRAWVACAGAGLAWAMWSLDPALEEDVATLSGPSFVALSCGVTVALAAGYAIADRHRPEPQALAPGRPLVLVAAALVAWATAVTFVPVPYAPVILVLLLGVAVWALRRLGSRGVAPDLPTLAHIGVPPSRLAPLAAFALCASVANGAASTTDVTVPALVVVFTVLSTTAVVAFATTIRLALRSPSDQRDPAGA